MEKVSLPVLRNHQLMTQTTREQEGIRESKTRLLWHEESELQTLSPKVPRNDTNLSGHGSLYHTPHSSRKRIRVGRKSPGPPMRHLSQFAWHKSLAGGGGGAFLHCTAFWLRYAKHFSLFQAWSVLTTRLKK